MLYRAKDGQIVALEDSCPHRRVPLSVGKLVGGDRIQWGYHGLEFDRAGACVFEPEGKKPLAWATVKSYPVAEKNQFVFIWRGDPALADAAKVPGYHTKFLAGRWSPFIPPRAHADDAASLIQLAIDNYGRIDVLYNNRRPQLDSVLGRG